MRIGITGASGYVGRAVVDEACRRGHEVVVLGRTRLSSHEFRPFDLRHDAPPGLLSGLDALIHLAAATGSGAWDDAELAAARTLAGSADAGGLSSLFISSQAASPMAPSAYGRMKAAIEEDWLKVGSVLRLGMVYGGRPMGLWWTLAQVARRMPALPALRPPPMVQPIHVRDASAAIVSALEHGGRGVEWRVAGRPMPFHAFMAGIAAGRGRAVVMAVPLPMRMAQASVRLVDGLVGARGMRERFDSLLSLQPMECAAHLACLGVRLRPFEDGVSKSGRSWRRLLQEGDLLARAHVPRARLRMGLRRYVRCMEADGGGAVALPGLQRFRGKPALVAALLSSPPFRLGGRSALAPRARLALALLESSPRQADAFLRRAGEPAMTLIADICSSACAGARALALAPLARKLYERAAHGR